MPLYFTNPGELDIRGATIMGLHAKESESIGYFGTGLKYAIAVLLREHHQITIWSGLTKYSFGIKVESFRGKQVGFIIMSEDDGEPKELGFTTDLGKNWKLWQAYRELRSNAMDEAGEVSFTPTEPQAGRTVIRVTGAAIEEVHTNSSTIFLESEPIQRLEGVSVHKGPSPYVFYRGVRAAQLNHQSIYTYNIHREMALTEDRTLAIYYYIGQHIGRAVRGSTDRLFIRAMLTMSDTTFEGTEIDYDWANTPSQEFEEVATTLFRAGKLVPSSATRWVSDQLKTKEESTFAEVQLSPNEQKQLARALDFLRRFGYTADDYPIKVAQRLHKSARGMADLKNEEIWLARETFSLGTKQVASTLLEEWAHLRHDLEDESRRFQDWLLDRLVSTIEEAYGEPI